MAWRTGRAGNSRPGSQGRRDLVSCAAPSPPVDAAPPQTAHRPGRRVAIPSFDIALIGPDGRGVIAGRAQPGAKIVLLDGDKELAQDQADANGEWVIIAQDPPLSAGHMNCA